MVRTIALVICVLAGICAAAASGTRLAWAAPVTGTLIHPGDQLSVEVFGDQGLTQNVMVLADGTIDYPLVGRVAVGGKTPSQAASSLAARLRDYVRHPVVTIAIAQLGQPNVMVLGDVKNPGKYQLPSDAKVSDAIAAAGGLINVNGAFPDARITNPNGQVTKVPLEELLQHGQTALDASLSEGSVVYVPGPIKFTVEVAGAVDHPGDVQVSEGDRLAVAIAKAGNSQNSQADLNHIRLIRTDASGKQTATTIDLYQRARTAIPSVDVPLQKGSVIFVPAGREAHGRMDHARQRTALYLRPHHPVIALPGTGT